MTDAQTDTQPTPTAQILVVEDEPEHAEVMAESLRRLGHVCTIVGDLGEAKEELAHGQFDLVVTDLVMEGEQDGLAVLDAARRHQPDAETILVTAHGDVPTAKSAIKGGAYDFIEKPLDLDVFRTLCDHALQAVFLRHQKTNLQQQLDAQYGFEGIIGNAPAMRTLIQQMQQVAPTHISVLISGESGTGKELVARAIHNHSKRKDKVFVPLNCAGLSQSILEDELFGHLRGAFTGAEKDRQGRFEYADGGTLFLDEVGDMPLEMQAKLLRVLESGEVVRLGANEPRHVNVRLISATNHDLNQLVKQGEFREDLFFRIKGAALHIPPLRERRDDIPVLAKHYAQEYANQLGRRVPTIAEDVMRQLMQYDWPGNVRELMNVIQNVVVLAEEDRIESRHLPPEIRQAAAEGEGEKGSTGPWPETGGMSLDQIEKHAIRNALRMNHGNREQAAKMLGIGERTLYRKLREYGLK